MRVSILASACPKAPCASMPRPWLCSFWPEARVTAQSIRKPWPSFDSTTSASPPRSKYLPMLVRISSEMRVISASPTATCLPETWTCISLSTRREPDGVKRPFDGASGGLAQHPLALHRGRYAHRLPVFGDGAAGDVDAGFLQDIDDGVVGMHVLFAPVGVDQLGDLVAHPPRVK